MSNDITANSVDALISYIPYDSWDYERDKACADPSHQDIRRIELNFAGTQLQAFGTYHGKISCELDQESCDGGLLPSDSLDRPFLTIQNLQRQPRTLSLSAPPGSNFCLSRVTWTDPLASSGPAIPINGTAAPDDGTWERIMNGSYNRTSSISARIEYNFQGTGIEVLGKTGPDRGNFSVTLDGHKPVTRKCYSSIESEATLYREDGLTYGSHTLVIENIENWNLTVGQARVFGTTGGPTASASVETMPTSSGIASAETGTPSPHHGIGVGGVVGVVIIVLVCLGLVLFTVWFRFHKKRQASHYLYEKNQVSYDRMCSKCRKAITGDFRLECVTDNCPAAIDLHPECEDWNVPDHHDHGVQRVPNE